MTRLDQYADQAHSILFAMQAKGERRYLGGGLRVSEQASSQTQNTNVEIDLRSNDYLGLRSNSTYNAATRAAMNNWPLGAGASRLLAGESPVFAETEAHFARFKGSKAALLTTCGFTANCATIGALVRAFPGASFYSDEFNHASIIDGLRSSRLHANAKIVFRHNDMDDLRERLENDRRSFKIIICESIYSMQGDFAPLAQLQQLAADYNALVVVDEAHSLGLYGDGGRGLVTDPHIITINPCGKAFAAQGAFICGSQWIKDLVVNFGRAFIYSTAISPCIAAALNISIDWVEGADRERSSLQHAAAICNAALDIADAQYSPIIFLPMPSIEAAAASVAMFRGQGVAVSLIRPPTAPTAGLRLCLHAKLSTAHINKIASLLVQVVRDAH